LDPKAKERHSLCAAPKGGNSRYDPRSTSKYDIGGSKFSVFSEKSQLFHHRGHRDNEERKWFNQEARKSGKQTRTSYFPALKLARCPLSLAASVTALLSMSVAPLTPFLI